MGLDRTEVAATGGLVGVSVEDRGDGFAGADRQPGERVDSGLGDQAGERGRGYLAEHGEEAVLDQVDAGVLVFRERPQRGDDDPVGSGSADRFPSGGGERAAAAAW